MHKKMPASHYGTSSSSSHRNVSRSGLRAFGECALLRIMQQIGGQQASSHVLRCLRVSAVRLSTRLMACWLVFVRSHLYWLALNGTNACKYPHISPYTHLTISSRAWSWSLQRHHYLYDGVYVYPVRVASLRYIRVLMHAENTHIRLHASMHGHSAALTY